MKGKIKIKFYENAYFLFNKNVIVILTLKVNHAKQWKTVPEQKTCSRKPGASVDKMITSRSKGSKNSITFDKSKIFESSFITNDNR